MSENQQPPHSEGAQDLPAAETEPKEVALEPTPALPFLVVALGASAGGLAALKSFLQAVPPDSGMAFVVIQHLDPERESLMASLLQQQTAMPVVQVTDAMPPEANRVYVIAPGTAMTLEDGLLRLREPEQRRGMRLPIDAFFTSLAEVQGRRAAGIVLSGTASDGTEGLRDIKAHGGLAVAQDPEEAEHEWMPRSAIATGIVDLILPVAQMPEALLKYQAHPYVTSGEPKPAPEAEETLRSILALIATSLGHDFQGYRKTTLLRRIHRRMGFRAIPTIEAYEQYLRAHADEISALFSDILIGVTKFFREPEAWEALKKLVVRPLLEREGNEPVRVWVPACSIGKEAYTLAMLFFATMEELGKTVELQVFATDVDTDSLASARSGQFPLEIAQEVPPEYLERFFIGEEKTFRVVQKVRQAIVFAPQNTLADPPFSRLDLISCRNLLIYLEPELQDRVMSIFHFSLSGGGYLFLGAAESVGPQELFEPLSKQWRIFQKLDRPRAAPLNLPSRFQRHLPPPAALPLGGQPGEGDIALYRLAESVVLERYAPASVVINNQNQILYYLGAVSDFLRHPRGEPNENLLAKLDDPLRGAVRSLIQQVRETSAKGSIVTSAVTDEGRRPVEVDVLPLRGLRSRDQLLVVMRGQALTGGGTQGASPVEPEVRDLEQELRSAHDEMQGAIEQMESSNEELTASNEEMASMNEELQAANEELETSKEELQSVNEELRTVNVELEEKVEQLNRATDDLDNLLRSTNIPTLFLDPELRLRRFTPTALSLFNFLPTDIGRPITDLSLELEGMDLIADAHTVLDSHRPVTREVQSAEGRLYLHRTQPYRAEGDAIKGVVATFVDVTDLALAQAELRAQVSKLETIMDVVPVALLVVQDAEGHRVTANLTAYELLGVPPGTNLSWVAPGRVDMPFRLVHAGQDLARDATPLAVAMRTGEPVEGYELDLVFDDHVVTILGSAAPLEDDKGKTVGAVAAYADITGRKEAETLRSRMAAAVEVSRDVIISVDPAGAITNWNTGAHTAYGYEMEQIIGKPYLNLMPAAEQPVAQAALDKAYTGAVGVLDEAVRLGQNGGRLPVSVIFSPVRNAAGQVTEVFVIERDITNWKHAVDELSELHETLKHRAAQLQSLAEQLAEVEQTERRRLAHLLHDGIQQVLASAKLKMQVARSAATGDLRTSLDEIERNLQDAIAESRNLTTQLSPPVSKDKPVSGALQWLAQTMQERYQYELHVQADPEAEPEQQLTKVVLFEAARELLFNSVKHSGVKEGNVTLALEGDDTLVLTVSDAGAGFDPTAVLAKTGGFGLFSIRERLELLGGTMEVESAPKQGVTFRLRVPRRGAGDENAR